MFSCILRNSYCTLAVSKADTLNGNIIICIMFSCILRNSYCTLAVGKADPLNGNVLYFMGKT